MAPTVPIEFIGQKESKKCWVSQPMGKSRKYSKGNLSGFVPDYRHAVETVGESEGFGNSGRVDTEMTVSEGSCAPKRKLISLNPDGYDGFGVPIQVLPLSKMSRSERKDLELRLKQELDLVRVLQKKMASLNPNTVMLSPSSDIWSCSDGQKRHSVDGLHRTVEVSASHSRIETPHGHNGVKTKKGAKGHHEPARPAASACTTTNAALMKQCGNLLNRLMHHKYGWVFNEPVDVVKLNIPDYFNVIKEPMDLGTVKSKMASGAYTSPLGFAADVRLTFRNALKYNPPDNDVHFMADTLSKFFESKWKAIEKKLPGEEPVVSGAYVPARLETDAGIPASKKNKIVHNNYKGKSEPVMRVMTDEEKHKLSMELEASLDDLPASIVNFLKEQSPNAEQNGEDEIEIDMDALSNDSLFKLRKLLDDYLLEKRKNREKAEACEMELLNESGFSNLPLPPPASKGNEPVDESIDIVGGNNPLASSFPPVETEVDAANKNSKCSSPSSSSESGSSSDSDSGSSSDSESEAAKASVPGTTKEENVGSAENLDHKRNDLGDKGAGNQPADGLGKIEPDSQGKQTEGETDNQQEGESDPPGRQVSPDKLYRAAILRNRFADTIFKARAKALEKGEKLDPEKLRQEKEELERKLKEEKARLLAEAKAAEEAQKRAAAEAAAEAKRKRELEREAARQALLQMEKTVEINENSLFMEDLKMLRATNDEELPSFIEETIQGSSNPLEQLGLYIKNDDEEEEEVIEPLQSVPKQVEGSSNPLEQLGLYMKIDDDEEEKVVEQPGRSQEPVQGSGNPLEQPGLHMKNDGDDEEKVAEPMQISPERVQGNSYPLEQLGLHMKNNDEEDEKVAEPPESVAEPVQGCRNTLEQLGLHLKNDDEEKVAEPMDISTEQVQGSSCALEQLGLHLKNDDDADVVHEEKIAEPPQSVAEPVQGCSNPLELGLHLKNDDKEEKVAEPMHISTEQVQGSSCPLEQLGLHMKNDDDVDVVHVEKVAEPPQSVAERVQGSSNPLEQPQSVAEQVQGSSNPLEQLGLDMRNDDEEKVAEPMEIVTERVQGDMNPLEQLGLYMKNDEEEEVVEPPQSVAEQVQGSSNPLEQLGPDRENDDDAEKVTEPMQIVAEQVRDSRNSLEQLGMYMKNDDSDDDDDEEKVAEPPQSIPEQVKDVEEGKTNR